MSEQQQPGEQQPGKQYKKYTAEQLEGAVSYYITHKDDKDDRGRKVITIRSVADQHAVPFETLRKKISKALNGVQGEGAGVTSSSPAPVSCRKRKAPTVPMAKGKGAPSTSRAGGRRPLNVLVTGASQGIGLSIALKFLEGGAHVVLVSRNIEKARSKIPSEYFMNQQKGKGSTSKKGKALLLSKDLASPAGCQECAVAAAELLGGHIDVLVNNAGAGTLAKNIHTTREEDWDGAFNLNLKSYMFMIQSSLPFLEASGRGSVVNISGVAAHRPFTSMLPYCCAKAGVEMLSKCCALELAAKGIRVNCVAPGTISTDFLAGAGLGQEGAHAFLQESAACHPLGRIGQPRDVAEAVYFLGCQGSSAFITGQSMILDGGRTLTLPSGKALKTS